MYKTCFKCNESKPLLEYRPDKNNKDGLKGKCKQCIREYNRLYDKKYSAFYNYTRLKLRRKEIKEKYGFGAGSLGRFGLKKLLDIYTKYDGCCDLCKTDKNLTIHHIDGKGRHWQEKGNKMNNELPNLQLLCRRCHGSIEGRVKSKINNKCRIKIKEMYNQGYRQCEIASKLNIPIYYVQYWKERTHVLN
jgi:5-methylcytosine-specific restriction endonuclease McrA